MEVAFSRTSTLPAPLPESPSYEPATRRPRTVEQEIGLVPARETDHELPIADVLPRDRSETASRVLNVAIASAALLAAFPILAIVAVAVKLTSRGPVLYMQTRIGMDRRYRGRVTDDRRAYDTGGKPFRIYKFRTMRVDAEADGRPVWASQKDTRATPIGGILRRYRIDELPQLFNVIRGDMNIVGPRPERPGIFANLRRSIPEYQLRQRVKPGITGWAQVNLAYDATIDDVRRKVQYDLEYLRRQGVIEDLRIMSKTIPVMIFRRGGW